MDIRSLLVADSKSAKLIKPGKAPLHCSTTQRHRLNPLPCSVLRIARRGTMPRSRRPFRIDCAS